MKLLLPVRRAGAAVTLLLLSSALAQAAPKGRLLFLGVAYDAAPPAAKTADHYNYAPDNLSDLLVEKAAPLFRQVKVGSLKGAQVTRENVIARLGAMRAALTADDLVFFYWGTHGAVHRRKGWNAGLADNSVLYGADIKQELSRFPCPVIIVVSTCGSGGFARQVSPADAKLPDNVAALCACRRQQSTGNELDVSLCEALSGFADFNADGAVSLREAMSYVPQRYRRWRQSDIPLDQQPVISPARRLDPSAPLVQVQGDYAAVVSDDRWYGVEVLERQADRIKVRFLGFDRTCADGAYSKPDGWVNNEAVDFPGGPPPIEVEWQGAWYPARILKRTADGAHIHYINYPASDDETVPASRIRYPFPSELTQAPGN